jgi:outer membrane protein, heavy metal efflux system
MTTIAIRLLLIAGLSAMLSQLSACAPTRYAPRPLEGAPLQAHLDRSPEDAGLSGLVAAVGYRGNWPPEQWTLETLTLAALYFNPRITTARAEAALARAELGSAAQRLPLGLQIAAEHHSRQVDADGPWSLGLALELPISGSGRRAARVDRASALAESAQLAVATAAWRVRGEVRDALLRHHQARSRIEALSQRLIVQQEMAALVRSRVDAGMLSARELGQELAAIAGLEVQLDIERAHEQAARAQLAAAIGLPLETVARMTVAGNALEMAGEPPSSELAREAALKNRLDIQRRLLEFGAADAEVRLAVASQYPEISLSPGFLWDQGDRIWALATALAFPPGAWSDAGVREAEARRELAALQFESLQRDAIARAEMAVAALDAVGARSQSASRTVLLADQQLARVQRLFDAGAAGRLELVAARLAAATAREARREADVARLEALAQLEDAIEQPLLGFYRVLPGTAPAQTGALR